MGNMEVENLGKNIGRIFDNQNKYIIPLYQRNFSWRREQIEQLLQDIYTAFKQNPNGNYYIGSLVVLKRSNGDFEVIDGQQRLTVLSLITKILGINNEPRLFYDSRPEVEEFFRTFYDSEDGSCNIDYPQTAHLRNAIDLIKEINLDPEKQTCKIKEDIENNGISFKQYFENNVVLVRVEIPQDTDVASYFEIMNNRGVQLQKHEILKSFLISKLKDKSRSEFAKIWTACSQIDIPIQKLFTVEDRRKYFGDNYDDFCFTSLAEFDNNSSVDAKTIDQILNENEIKNVDPSSDSKRTTTENNDENEDETKYRSIIDFPNFLMHVFKVLFPEKEIPLNEKDLISVYKLVENELDSEAFINNLLFCRTIFDKYIVKTVIDDNDKSEDNENWTLKKPSKKDNNSWDYINTFSIDREQDKQNNQNNQERIVKALTMLQVTFRSRTYKNWLFEILRWFTENKNINVGYCEYIEILDKIILKHFDDYNDLSKYQSINENESITVENSYSKGLKTPHFLLNFIDYLYWVDWKNITNLFDNSKQLETFDFKYWNSIEHHMAKEWAERNREKFPDYDRYIDNLGNLCLISKSSNSRLSDRNTKEKAETFNKGNLGAKRQIMYNITNKNGGNFHEEQIKKHYNELLELIAKREVILGRNPIKTPSLTDSQ